MLILILMLILVLVPWYRHNSTVNRASRGYGVAVEGSKAEQ